MEKNTFIMDIDGTICHSPQREDGSFDYENATPIEGVISRINELYDAGHTIVLNTARGMRTHNGDVKKVEKHMRPNLEKWLADNGVKYHQLVMGKAWGENPIYVDNRNLSIKSFALENPEFFENIIKAECNI
jgi:capsule biosynthesis phosphatase